MDLPLASLAKELNWAKSMAWLVQEGLLSCHRGSSLWWHWPNPLFSLCPERGCDQNKSSVCGQKARDPPSQADWADRSLLPPPFSHGYNAWKTFWRPKMSMRQESLPPPQVTWVYLIKWKCLHITADTEAVKLEDSWSGDQGDQALKVLKIHSFPHPLQIWLNAYKLCYCLQYFTLLTQEFWNLLSILLFYHQLLNYCWGRFIHSPSYHKYPGI